MTRRDLLRVALALAGLLITSAPARAVGRATLVAGGDVLLARGVARCIGASKDTSALLSGLAPWFAGADAGLANLECPLSDSGTLIRKKFMFRASPVMAPFLRRAGFTVLSLANNHAYDCGRDGLMETAANLRRAGIEPLGAGLDQREAARPVLVGPEDMRIALLGFVDVPLEGLMPLPDRPGPALAETKAVVNAIRAARARADRVVVFVHWGREYRACPTERQRALAARMVEAGADVVIGHHPHVIEDVERIGRGLVVYSVGNLVFDQTALDCTEGLLVRCQFTEQGDTLSLIPMRIAECRPDRMNRTQAKQVVGALRARSPSVTFTERPDGWWDLR